MDDYQKLIEIIEGNPGSVEFGEFGYGVSDDWIQKGQTRLNVVFPASYIWWLKNYKGGEINGEEIFSIYELDFNTVVGGDIVYVNELNRKKGFSNENELIIQENDQGETFIFDLTKRDVNGEYRVFNQRNGNKYADNFIEFLVKKIYE